MDPRNPFYQVRLGNALSVAGREDEAIALLQQVRKSEPTFRPAGIQLAYAYADKGMHAEAFAVMEQNQVNAESLQALRRAYAEGGFLRAARVRPDAMAEQAQRMYVSPSGISAAYMRAGEKDLALQWLEKAFEEHETTLVNLGGNRLWSALRGDPRFEALRAQMKFPN